MLIEFCVISVVEVHAIHGSSFCTLDDVKKNLKLGSYASREKLL